MPETPRLRIPYPSASTDPYFPAFEQMLSALDQAIYPSREDRNLLLQGGGTIAFTASSGLLSWSGSLELFSAPTGFYWQVAAGSINLNDGEVLYARVTRSPLTTQPAVIVKGTQVPVSAQEDPNTCVVIAQRRGTLVYFRNGRVITDGQSGSVLQGSSLSAAGTITVKDEGGTLSTIITKLNFEGAGVTAAVDGGDSAQVNVTIPGGGGGGDVFLAGPQTFTGLKTFLQDDGVTGAVTDVIILTHTATGAPANGLATGILFQSENSTPATVDQGRISALWLDVNATTEDSALAFWSRTGGAALAERMRLGQGLSVGLSADPGPGGIAVPNNASLYGLSTGAVLRSLAKLDGSDIATYGDAAVAASILGTAHTETFTTTWALKRGAAFQLAITTVDELTAGDGDATTAPGNFLIRGPAGTGADTDAGIFKIRGSTGTGTGATGSITLEIGTVGSSGSTPHATRTIADFADTQIHLTQNTRIDVRDAVSGAVSVALDLQHLLASGTAAAEFGPALLFSGPDDGGTTRTQGGVAAVWTDAVSGSRSSALSFYVVTATATAEQMRLRHDGALRIRNPTTLSTSEGPGVSLGAGAIVRGLNDAAGLYLHLLQLNGAADDLLIGETGSSKNTTVQVRTGTNVASSGVSVLFQHNTVVNQSGTAGYTAIDANVTESGTGSGLKKLIDLRVGSASRFEVRNTGQTILPNAQSYAFFDNAGTSVRAALLLDASDILVVGDAATTKPIRFATGYRIARVGVADADHSADSVTSLVAYTSLSVTRTVTLPTAASVGEGFVKSVKDESGSASSTVKISTVVTGGATIDGSAAAVEVTTAYGGVSFYSNGTNWFTFVS